MSPVGAGWSLEAEEGTRLLVDPSLALQVAPRVLHVLLNHTAWERASVTQFKAFNLRIQIHLLPGWRSQIREQ